MRKTKNKITAFSPELQERLFFEDNQQSKTSFRSIADCYRTLGLSETASSAEVYRALKEKLCKYNVCEEKLSHFMPGSTTELSLARILEKIIVAYRTICEFRQYPEQYLVESLK